MELPMSTPNKSNSLTNTLFDSPPCLTKEGVCDIYIVEFVHDATKNYYERGKYGCWNFHVTKTPPFILKVPKLLLFYLPMLVTMCFFDLFSYKIPMHRKWVRLKCVSYLLIDALFCFNSYFLCEHLLELLSLAQRRKEKHSWEITQCFYIQFFFFSMSLGSYYYCNDLSLSFLFRFCAKNLSEVRFVDVAVLKQFSVLHRKNV
jgi:hypothetical protein